MSKNVETILTERAQWLRLSVSQALENRLFMALPFQWQHLFRAQTAAPNGI